SQELSWPKQLAAVAGAEFSIPRIAAPGCTPAFASPLGSFRRVDGTPVTANKLCAPLEPGVSLPTSNLSIEGATAAAALTETPEAPLAGRDRPAVVSRVLPSGMTQVQAMRAMQPTFVTVDFGGNEILQAQAGLFLPNVTVTPFATFRTAYDQVIDNVRATGAKALLMQLPSDIRQFPTIRTAQEIAAQRAAFAVMNVTVSGDCDESPNFVFVRGKVITAVATGAGMARAGAGPYTLSCADVPFTADYILTPADIESINGLLAQMNGEIAAQAQANGYALASLDAVYRKSKKGVPFDLQAFMTSATPYGPRISLDGVHPNEAGQRLITRNAVKAINAKYAAHLVPPQR
ncbi:MAG TPA: SGNH/GDSL hydrolase family protein, partial [Gemmatimonadaceae bacterium]|nr:SGNH/GDSL hydrolase family protein [Gemmatimonadaceae bacterium]